MLILVYNVIYIISPFGNYYYSYFGTYSTKWFVNETLEKITSEYLKRNLELQINPQEEKYFILQKSVGFAKPALLNAKSLLKII